MVVRFDNELYHHGVFGQKHGLRRYQYPDGSLTPEGRRHWGVGPPREKRKSFRLESKEDREKRLELKRQKKEAKKAERLTNKKIAMINRGNREKIYKNRKLFSDDELKYIDSRLNLTEKFGKNEPKQTYKEKRKQNILNSGDLDKIYKNQKLFTNQELKDAVSRAESLKKLDPEEQKKRTDNAKNSAKNGKSVTDSIIDATGKLAKVGANAIALYGAYNKIAAAVNEVQGQNVLPTFSNTPWTNTPTSQVARNPINLSIGSGGVSNATVSGQSMTPSNNSASSIFSLSPTQTGALQMISGSSGQNNQTASTLAMMNNSLSTASTITIQDLMNNP